MKNHFPPINFSYLDSGASTLTPHVVLDAMNEYYTKYRANIHRGVYDTSVKATEKYEAARADVAAFINAKPEEIIFTSGTTMGLNMAAYLLSPRLSPRDNIVLTKSEHHANLVPWQQMAKHYGFEIRFIDIDPTTYQLQATSYNAIDENTKIVSLTYISNVLGIVNPVEEIIKLTREKAPKAYTIVDAAQAVAHIPVDVQKIDCDFLAFSGHKMYGPTGIGVLYGKKTILEEHIEPFLFGGDMIKSVSLDQAVWNDVPYRFEAGTPNIAGVIGLGAAVRFIQTIGWEKIQTHETELTEYAFNVISKTGVQLICHSDRASQQAEESLHDNDKIGILSFTIPGVHPHDIGDILNQEKVAIRAGFHCAEPLHRLLGLNQGTVRASLGIYNTEKDIDRLVQGIEKVKKLFS